VADQGSLGPRSCGVEQIHQRGSAGDHLGGIDRCRLELGAPIALSIYATRKAPSVTRLTPEALEDLSISTAQGEELSYFGYRSKCRGTISTRLKPSFIRATNPLGLFSHSGSGCD